MDRVLWERWWTLDLLERIDQGGCRGSYYIVLLDRADCSADDRADN